jgi:hypothetical protein
VVAALGEQLLAGVEDAGRSLLAAARGAGQGERGVAGARRGQGRPPEEN